MPTLNRAIEQIPDFTDLESGVVFRIILTLLILLLVTLLRMVSVRLVRRYVEDVRRHYQWRRFVNYLAGVTALLLIGWVWLPGLREIGVVLGLASAGIAIALRDPIVSIFGWIFILARRPFVVGDRIEINDQIGDVIDIRMFQTYLLECRNWIDGDQSTGRVLLVPNNTIFTATLANYTHALEYIWDEIVVRLTFESDWRKAKSLLTEIAETHVAPLSADAQQKLRQMSGEHLIVYQKLTPIVYTTVKEWGVQLSIRYLTPPRQRRSADQRMWEAILDAFAGEPGIQFAYPTTRFYDRAREGGETAARASAIDDDKMR